MPSLNLLAPQQYQVYNPEYKPGQKTDLTRYTAANVTGPRQVSNPLIPQGQAGPFSLSGANQAIQQGGQTGGQIAVNAPRYQTTDQLTQGIGAITQALKPQTDLQAQAAQQAFNQNLGNLQSSWAKRGLLSSGAAASQEQQALQGLAQQQAGILANAQAQAIPLALQYGQLGLQEANQLFGQQAQNRAFDYGRSQDTVKNLMAGLGQQEQSRQFDTGVGLDVEKLRSQEYQNYLNNLARELGMEQSQNQWSQEYGLQQQQNDFNRWLQTGQLNAQNANAWNQAQLGLGNIDLDQQRIANQASQFGQTFGLQQGKTIAELGLQQQQQDLAQKQANLNAALQAAGLTGYVTGPTSNWGALFNPSYYQGNPLTQAAQLQQANISGINPLTGQLTLSGRTALGQLLGTDPITGQPTVPGLQAQASLMSASRPAGGGYTQAQQIDDLFRVWQGTGIAPTGLEGFGVTPGTAYASGAARDMSMENRQNDEIFNDAKDYIKGVTAEIKAKYENMTSDERKKLDPNAMKNEIKTAVIDYAEQLKNSGATDAVIRRFLMSNGISVSAQPKYQYGSQVPNAVPANWNVLNE